MQTEQLKQKIASGELDETLLDIYVDERKLEYQKKRYLKAIKKFENLYGIGEAEIITRSPFPISTFLWSEKAILVSALIGSP